MKLYSYDAIKQHVNCLDFATLVLGMTPIAEKNNGFNIPWRSGSDSGALSINDRGWHDFVTKESGSVIDLCAKVKFGGDMIQAQEFLGDYYNLVPAVTKLKAAPQLKKTRFAILLEQGYKVIKQYDYKKDGLCVHSVVRMHHPEKKKEFVQRTPKGWGGVKDITRILYNYDEIINSDWCIICEGEKDADNLIKLGFPATTNAGGSSKWEDQYNETLANKRLAILHDNDSAGRDHAVKFARKLYDYVKEIRIVKTSDKPKGDVSNYIEDGHTKEDIFRLIQNTPVITMEELNDTDIAVREAKRANRYDFKNYFVTVEEKDGKKTKKKNSRPLHDLIKEVHNRFLGFPKRIGDELFDYNRDNKEIEYIYNVANLFAWMQAKSQKRIDWFKGDDAVSKAELFEGLKAVAKKYEGFSYVPDYPLQNYMYYLPVDMPEPHPDHKYFEDFILHFNPATTSDLIMLKTLFAAPLFCSPKTARPLWIIDSLKGQESGKSTIAHMLAELYGVTLGSQSVLDIEFNDIKNNESELKKRLVSTAASLKKIVLIDNVEGHFKSSFLASLTTAKTIAGRPVYGRGEKTIRNRFTYIITVNSAMLDTDLASRSYFINLDSCNKNKHWTQDVLKDINKNRFHIIADMLDIIKNNKTDYPTVTRFPEFESGVLAPMCDDMEQYSEIYKHLSDQKMEADSSIDQCKTIEEKIYSELQLIGIAPDMDNVFIRSAVFNVWFPRFGTYPTQIIKNHIKKDRFKYLSLAKNKDKEGRRGLYWDPKFDNNSYRIIDIKHEKVAVLKT